jgi:hypothetical protein
MSASSDHRTGKGAWDGALTFVVNSPTMSLETAAANQGAFVAPCNGEIVAIIGNLIEAPGTAAGTVNIGTVADVDHFLDAYSIATTAAVGVFEIPLDNTAVVNTTVTKGDVIEFDTGGEATTTGIAAFTVVINPIG